MQGALSLAAIHTRGRGGCREEWNCVTPPILTQTVLLLAHLIQNYPSLSLIQILADEEFSTVLCKKFTVFCMLAKSVVRRVWFAFSKVPLKVKREDSRS